MMAINLLKSSRARPAENIDLISPRAIYKTRTDTMSTIKALVTIGMLVILSITSVVRFSSSPMILNSDKAVGGIKDNPSQEVDGCGANVGQPGFDVIVPNWRLPNPNETPQFFKEVETCTQRFKGHLQKWSKNESLKLFDCSTGVCSQNY
jgi:hypothetical protein